MSFQLKSRASWLLALLFACMAAGAAAWGYHEHQLYEKAAGASNLFETQISLKEGDNARLQELVARQKKQIDAAYEAEQRKSIEQDVVAIRGLDFKHPVEYETLSHADIKKILAEKMADQYSDEDFKHISASLGAFGLLEPNYPLKEKYIALLGEQIAAFYDQHHHKLFMFEDATLHDTQNRVILAHELTHALQDQHFNLLSTPLEVKNNDDLALATSALVEGDATLLMMDYESKHLSLQTFTDSISSALTQNMQQLIRAPRYLRETLYFPYSAGRQFCEALYQRGGYQAISDAFTHPPVSTTQILHPEKYFANEQPILVAWPDTSLGAQKPTDNNVIGEFGIRVLLEKYMGESNAEDAAEGWRGDRYLVFGDGKGLVWKTLWADDERARNFREALLLYVEKRLKHSTADTSDPARALFSSPAIPATPATPDRPAIAAVPARTGEIISAKDGNGIIFIWGETKEFNDALVQKFKE